MCAASGDFGFLHFADNESSGQDCANNALTPLLVTMTTRQKYSDYCLQIIRAIMKLFEVPRNKDASCMDPVTVQSCLMKPKT